MSMPKYYFRVLAKSALSHYFHPSLPTCFLQQTTAHGPDLFFNLKLSFMKKLLLLFFGASLFMACNNEKAGEEKAATTDSVS